MSTIAAIEWATRAKKQLTELEQSCSEEDLFCVGYLIPQVELVELQFAEHEGAFEDWQYTFSEFVDESLKKDNVAENDSTRIQSIIADMSH